MEKALGYKGIQPKKSIQHATDGDQACGKMRGPGLPDILKTSERLKGRASSSLDSLRNLLLFEVLVAYLSVMGEMGFFKQPAGNLQISMALQNLLRG